jgi:hypothetical protein
VFNRADFQRMLTLPEEVKRWSMTTQSERLVKIDAKIVWRCR